jgi:hypothetical protein
MKIERTFISADRYLFDFGECSFKNGFAQIDTTQDASYYGIWANPVNLEIVSYCEGDVYKEKAENPQEFAERILQIKSFLENLGHRLLGIDTGTRENMANKFRSLGLGDLLH